MRILDVIDHLPHHPTRRYRARKESAITHIVVHHSATRKGTPEQFAMWHVQKGWPGIGYHYVVARNGITYKTNPVLKTTYHARGANRFSIGICLVGNFQETKPRSKQLEALKGLIEEITKALPTLRIIGHCDVCSTSCPGRYLYAWLKEHYD